MLPYWTTKDPRSPPTALVPYPPTSHSPLMAPALYPSRRYQRVPRSSQLPAMPQSLKTYSDFELLIGEDESGVCGSEITGTGRETCSLSVASSPSQPHRTHGEAISKERYQVRRSDGQDRAVSVRTVSALGCLRPTGLWAAAQRPSAFPRGRQPWRHQQRACGIFMRTRTLSGLRSGPSEESVLVRQTGLGRAWGPGTAALREGERGRLRPFSPPSPPSTLLSCRLPLLLKLRTRRQRQSTR